MLILKDEELTECFVVSTHVPKLKHKVKQRHITETALSAASGKQTKLFNSVFLYRNISGHDRTFGEFLVFEKRALIVFFNGFGECSGISVVFG